jgi:hypothetical protein
LAEFQHALFDRGLTYLSGVRSLASTPELIHHLSDFEHRRSVCIWLGEHIESVNLYLKACLQRCLDCFHAWEQPVTQIYAVPFDPSFSIDGFCDFQANPIALLIDVGRVMPQDWLALVLHECAHAYTGSPGHDAAFARSLTHLCLGLDIAPPPAPIEDELRFYPYCIATADPLAFWRGEAEHWRSHLPDFAAIQPH